MPQEQSQIRERQRTNIKEPKKYRVIMYNDDFTTMEFVVKVLKVVFFMTEENAEATMLKIHHSSKAIVGVYTFDLATSKAKKAVAMARAEGYPLRLSVEPEE